MRSEEIGNIYITKQDQQKLEQGLEKTRASFLGKMDRLLRGRDTVDEAFLDDLLG